MTVTAPIANGRPHRKMLSDELTRLDGIIDSIAEGLPAAVAAAAREGTRQAVKDAIIEIATNPELRAMFQPAASLATSVATPSEPIASKPSVWSRIKANLAAAKAAIIERARVAKIIAAETFKTVTMIVPIKQIVMVTAVGMMAGVILHFAPTGLSTAIACVAGAVAAGLTQVRGWFNRSARTLLATG